MKELLEMKLHDQIYPPTSDPISITRVPGGWIYSFFDAVLAGEDGKPHQEWVREAVFVPYSEK